MTDLIVRKLRFAFSEYPVPFLWNEANPAFSSMANAVSLLAIGFEKMIVSTMADVTPTITDPEIAEEADAFTRQEGQHSMAHRGHVKALIKLGATRQELDEMLAIAVYMGGGPALMYAAEAVHAWDEMAPAAAPAAA